MSEVSDLIARRIRDHLLGTDQGATIADTARHMMAMQAQELWGGKFGLSVRTEGAPGAREVDAAFDRGEIVRTWPFRGTLHVLAAEDVAFALSVATDRVLRSVAPRHRELGISNDDITRAEGIARTVLRAGGLSRPEFWAALAAGGVDPAGQRGTHVVLALALRGVVHWGQTIARADAAPATQQLLQLNDDLPTQREVSGDAVAELFRRFLRARSASTAEDFAWWSGLTITRARAAAAAIEGEVDIDDEGRLMLRNASPASTDAARLAPATTFLLPSFDEYYLSYRDRTLTCDPQYLAAVGPAKNGMVQPLIVRDGKVVAIWKRSGEITVLDPTFSADETVLGGWEAHVR